MYIRLNLCENLSLSMFLRCSYFFTKSEADVLKNSVLRQNTACTTTRQHISYIFAVSAKNTFLSILLQRQLLTPVHTKLIKTVYFASPLRRRLTVCPILEGEEHLRLLNFQHNLISRIQHLARWDLLCGFTLHLGPRVKDLGSSSTRMVKQPDQPVKGIVATH